MKRLRIAHRGIGIGNLYIWITGLGWFWEINIKERYAYCGFIHCDWSSFEQMLEESKKEEI